MKFAKTFVVFFLSTSAYGAAPEQQDNVLYNAADATAVASRCEQYDVNASFLVLVLHTMGIQMTDDVQDRIRQKVEQIKLRSANSMTTHSVKPGGACMAPMALLKNLLSRK